MDNRLLGSLVLGLFCVAGCAALQQAPAPNDSITRNVNEMKARPRAPVILPDEREIRLAALTKQVGERDAELAKLRQTAGDLTAANRRIGELEGQIGERDRELAGLRQSAADLTAANRRAGELESQLGERDRELSALRQGAGDLTAATRRIGDLESQLADRDRELAALRQGSGDLAALTRKSADLEQQLAQRDAELAQLKQAAGDRDRLTSLMTASATDLEETKRRLAEQTKRADDLTGSLSSRDQEIARLNGLVEKGQGSGNDLAQARQQLASLSGTLSERDQEILRLRSQLDQRQAEKDLLKALQPEIHSGHVTINQAGDKLTVGLAAGALFDSGRDELKPAGVDVLKRVGGILKDFPQQAVHVAGYTDNVPIRGALAKKFPTNKELSDARAANAASLLEGSGVPKTNLTAAGHGDEHPVADNKTSDGRSKNRRVEIVLSGR